VVTRSEWLGFPPFAARADRAAEPRVQRFAAALRGLAFSALGREALGLLFLDRIEPADPRLFDGIALRMAEVAGR
jgi:phosphonate transport system substrate-binding protein